MRWCVVVILLCSLSLGTATAASSDCGHLIPRSCGAGHKMMPPLANGHLNRSWTWGPLVERQAAEPYS